MKKTTTQKTIIAVSVAVVFAFFVRLIFGLDALAGLLGIMSLTFFILLPVGIGVITVYLSSLEMINKFWYKVFVPWVPILCFLILTLVLSIEGWACWLMVLPFYLLGASIGGIIGAALKSKRKNKNLYVSLIAIAPFLIAPIEQQLGPKKEIYKVYTFIDISAPKSIIWQNVTRVKSISVDEDKGKLNNLLGMPRPIKAELDFEGVGAKREAIFERGLVFDEKVLEYQHEKRMLFSITANPFEIPSTTMDEHILIGGEYFDVIDGAYELEYLTDKTYRLHLHSHFSMNTTFNFYASWWGKLIMQDIQDNILLVIKKRAEK